MPDWRHPAIINTLTFAKALRVGPSLFNNKIVIIGVDFEFEDKHYSPASEKKESGAVFQARVVDALRSDRKLLEPAWPLSSLAPAVLCVLLMLVFNRRASQGRLMMTGLTILIGLGSLMVGLLAVGVVLKPLTAASGVLVTLAILVFQGYTSLKESFGRYLSREVRDEILSGRIPLDGEFKDVTVLFADLRDFTPMVETTPPKEVVRIMNIYFKEMAETIREHRGLVLQYIGDEIMAVFGAPAPLMDHAALALKAALEMRKRLNVVNHMLEQQGHRALRNGIGIHSGEALAANIGGGDRITYSLIGDTVNLASRLQGLSKTFGTDIIISEDTLARLGGTVRVKKLPTTPIKGKTRLVDIYEVQQE
jgi:class 3 adenylate cyclase